MIPEALAAQKIARDREEPTQDGGLIPLGHCCLAGRCNAAVDRGKSYVGADADALGSFPGVAIDGRDQLELLCQVIQGGGCRKVGQDDLFGFGDLRRGSHGRGDVFGLAKVLLPNDLRLAIDALTLAGIPIGVSADAFLVQAYGHGLGHTLSIFLPLVKM